MYEARHLWIEDSIQLPTFPGKKMAFEPFRTLHMFGQNLGQMFSELWVWLIVFDGIILNFSLKRPLRKPKRQAEKNVPYVVRGNSHPLENRSIWIWLTRWAPCRNFIWINFPFKEKDEEIYNLYSLQLTVICSVITSVIIIWYIYPCIIYMLSFRCCSILPISIMPTNCMQRHWTLTRLSSKTRCLAMQVNFILHICWGSLFPVQIFQRGWLLLIFVSDYNKFEPDK